VRCSLLALSSYIDAELEPEPAGELEAHLVACDRCRTAIGHLREESSRIGDLARVHVPDDAVHELFSQIGLIAEEDDLPEGPVRHDRPASVEAPPWFGAERGAALPWSPRRGHDQSQPRELIGERSPTIAVADPPELLLWDETIDQIATTAPAPPPVHPFAAPEPLITPDPQPLAHLDAEPQPVAHRRDDSAFDEPQPPHVSTEPQPPDLSTSAPMPTAPRLAAGPSAFQRFRDAVAVRLALRRGAGSKFDSGVEIVSGVGAPKWNQRARTQHWSDSPPVVAEAAPEVVEPASPPPVVRPKRTIPFMARITAERVATEPVVADDSTDSDAPAAHATRQTLEATAPLELADVLNEVASLAAPLERSPSPATDAEPAAATPTADATPATPAPSVDVAPARLTPVTGVPPATSTAEDLSAAVAPTASPEIDIPDSREDEMQFGVDAEPASIPLPGRHLRRLHSQRSDRRGWNPAQPVTGRHVLPLGGPAVGAADRDRRLWLFGAVTVVLMLLGLLIGRQVTNTGPLVASTIPRSAPTHHAATPPTAAPLPVTTPAPAPTAVIPVAPTPQALTGAKTIGSGSTGFSVADVRYGEHPNDFRLVFDMAFPNTVTGSPTTAIGYAGPTTLYVEFTGVNGASNVASMPPGQVVVSVVPLPMVRNTGRLIFKITLRKNAPFDAYYLSGARLIIDVT
jgi:Putative zinc-finger